MIVSVAALIIALIYLSGPWVALLFALLLVGGYAGKVIGLSALVLLGGATGAGLLLARKIAPAIAAGAFVAFSTAPVVVLGLTGRAPWTAADLAEALIDVNLAMGLALLLILGVAVFRRHTAINWFHVTYAPLVTSAAAPSAILFARSDAGLSTTLLTAALMVLVPAASHGLGLRLRSQGSSQASDSASQPKRIRLPYPAELRRQLARARRAARSRGKGYRTVAKKAAGRGARAGSRRGSVSATSALGDPQPAPPAAALDHRSAPPDTQAASAPAMPDPQGLPIGTARLSERIKEHHARYTTLVDNLPHIVLFTDSDGRVLSVNQAAKRILGFKPSALIGNDIKQLIPRSSSGEHPLDLRLLIKAPGETISLRKEAAVLRRDGKSIRTAIYVDEVARAHTAKYAVQILPTDELKRAERLLDKARATAHASQRSRMETLAAMSHELRTPLHGLIATLDMLRDEMLSAESGRKLTVAKTSAKTLLKLVNDVLDIARAKGPDFPLKAEPFNLVNLLNETLDEFSARAAAKGIELRRDIEKRLPKSHIGDRQRVKQILANLLSNAIKFTAYGGVTLTVRRDSGTLVVDVSDTGPGIPVDATKSIFDPFVTLKTESSVGAGTGLGLSISRQLSRAMGGDLILLNTSTAGSTFRATLKLEESDEEAPEDHSNRIFTNPAGRVLVVEDHEINQYVVKAMLDSLGCSVRMATDGNQALEALKEETFDLVLMDCRMPGLDGYEATRRAKKQIKVSAPIIAMTANASHEERSECIQAGMDDFIAKPFGRAELSQILCKWLDPRMKKAPIAVEKPPELDEDVFDELWESLRWNGKAMRNIHESFLQTLDGCARSVLAGGADIGRQIHTLTGTSGMVGAREINRIARKMSDSFRSGKRDDLSALVTQLRAAAKTFSAAFLDRLEEKLGQARGVRRPDA